MSMEGVHTLTFGVVFIILAASVTANKGVNISVYNIDTEKFTSMKESFSVAIAEEATIYCKENCPEELQSDLMANLTAIVRFNFNTNVTVQVYTENGTVLSDKHTEKMFHARVKQIDEKTNQRITSASDEFYGIAPDNPNNWIIIAVFAIITLALLFAVIYLSKHKVNHAEEHYEQIKSRETTADGEIAA